MRLIGRTLDQIHSPIGAAHALLAERTNDRPLLDLSQAAPSYPTAPVIADHIAAVARSADGGRYCPQQGLPELLEVFAAELSADYRGDVDPSQVLITAGCNQAFCLTVSALADPGDEVILPLPYYFNHDMWLRLEGINPVHLPTGADLMPEGEQAARLITDRTRAIVLVTPGNPSGATVPPETIHAFAALAAEHDVALIIDETYRSFRPTTEPAHDLFARPRWDEQVISLHSFSKDLAIPGYRVGAVVGGPPLITEVMKLLDCVAICAPRIGQEAVIAGLTRANDWRRAHSGRIAAAQGIFEETMATRPGGFELTAAGAFFGWVRHPFEGESTQSVVRRLAVDHDVLTIPGVAFTPGDDRFLRFSFANLDAADFVELDRRLNEMSAMGR
ncbi:MAG: aminotransferase [Actinomycetia bacterium]|nr:aminotransferase [Actinomycetes bacterium]